MPPNTEAVRARLSGGPLTARQLVESLGLSQPTISRALAQLGEEVVRVGAGRAIQYALRDPARGLPDIPVYRVGAVGLIRRLGTLIPVRPEGFVMRQEDGVTLYSEGLPWWLADMRPQGYLGRAYAARHGAGLGHPERLGDWTDTHVLRALLAHGHDVVGNLLLGDIARERFLETIVPEPIEEAQKPAQYVRFAQEAASGERPGSSAGGEQPKFATYAITPSGPRHVLVKFTEPEESPITERWRDLLLAEHLALDTLSAAGISAATTWISDFGGQRFLEVERFDRIGELGRRAMFSLGAIDAEFIGSGARNWAEIAARLGENELIVPEAVASAGLLWAFGLLIGNSDMHNGNLSFMAEHGRPYGIAPAYDMTSMCFAPRTGGGLPDGLSEAIIHASVPNETWRSAETLARAFIARVEADPRFSNRFQACITALRAHIETASAKIARLG